jgi:hypothetical protein
MVLLARRKPEGRWNFFPLNPMRVLCSAQSRFA